MRIRFGIRTRFTLLILGTVAIVLISSMAVTLTTVRRFTVEDVEDFSVTILQETNTKVTTFIAEIEYLARALADYRVVRTLETTQFRDLFLSHVLVRRYLRAIYLGTADGRMYEYGQGPGFVDHRPSLPEDYDPRRRPWYRAALEAGDFAVSDPYLYASYPLMGITGAVPVYDLEHPNRLVGVLGVDILLDDLRKVLWDLQIPKEGKALLIDDDGTIIASQFDPADGGLEAQTPFDPRLFARIRRNETASFTAEYQGRTMIMSHTLNPATGWYLVLALPYAAVMEPANRVLRLMLIMDAILLTLLLSAIRTISSRLVLHPLEEIVATVGRLHQGERDARVSVGRGDEFGLLAREFNELVAAVQVYSEDMEAQVAERTDAIRTLERENARLRLVEETERIYRDLHDSLGAQLTNISICTAVAKTSACNDRNRLTEMLDRIDFNARTAIEGLRETILGQPDFHSLSGVIDRLDHMVHRRLSIHGTELTFDTIIEGEDGVPSADPRVLETLYRVGEETVSNIQRHTTASKVLVSLRIGEGELEFTCQDNGRGFDPQIPSHGMGLANMRHRAGRCGGSVQIRSGAEGTTVTLRLPLWIVEGAQ